MNREKLRTFPRTLPRAIAVAATMVAMAHGAHAADVTEENDNFKVFWTNTVKYSAGFRLQDPSATLLANPNADDSNRNFSKGLMSNRIDLLSELDVVSRSGLGARLSAAGWYDSIYNNGNSNPGTSVNQTSVAANQFTNKTRELMGGQVEMRDAFIFGKTEVGGMPLTARLGQHALVWGESLFFAGNAIAGGQSAFDVSRLLADPTAQAKEFVLPVPQVSAQLQVSPDVTLGAYYQFGYKANRMPAVGSYFSTSDTAVNGAENLLLPGLPAARRDADMMPSDSGQYGVQAKWRLGETDLGFYAIRFHDKDFQQVVRLGSYPFLPPNVAVPTSYYLTYNEATTAVGASASHSFGEMNVAIEASVRDNQALASSGHAADTSGLAPPGVIAASNNTSNPAYAVGSTGHINVNTIWALQPSALWREATFVGELAWNRLLNCSKSCNALDPNVTRDAVAIRAVFEPAYRQVLPGLDLSVPLGVGYTPSGSRSVMGPAFPSEGGGDLTLGLNGVYEQTWRFSLAYTHFFGPADTLLDTAQSPSFTYQQSRADRDFLSFSIRRSF